MAGETICLLHEGPIFMYQCNPTISLWIQSPPGSVTNAQSPRVLDLALDAQV